MGSDATGVWISGVAGLIGAEYETRVGWGHSTIGQALAFAELARVGRFVPFHHDPAHSDSDIDALIEEALGHHRESGGSDVAAFPAVEEQELIL